MYLESQFFFQGGLTGFRRGFGGVAALEAGFRGFCGVEYLESENIFRKCDVN